MQAGEIVFAKKLTELFLDRETKEIVREDEHTSSIRGARYITMLLGQLKPKTTPPTPEEMSLLLLSIGYIGTNDITACLGEEATIKLINYVKENNKVSPERQQNG